MSLRTSLVWLERAWLPIALVLIPLSTATAFLKPFAVSYVNIVLGILVLLGLANALTGEIPFPRLKDKGALAAISLLFAVMAYALLFTHPLSNGAGIWISRLLLPLATGWCVYGLLEADLLTVGQLVGYLFLSLVPQIFGGALQLAHIVPYQDPANRVTVAYRWPNTFARYIEILLLLSFPWILAKVRKPEAWKAWTVWGVGVVLLLSSISYNGVVTFTAVLVVALLALPLRFRKLQGWAVGAIVVVGLLTAVNAPKLPKWTTSTTSSEVTRLEFWHVAEGAIGDHPWTGIGLKAWELTYPQLLTKYGVQPYKSLSSPQPHDVFLDSLLKAGIPGLIGIIFFMLWPILAGYRLFRRDSFDGLGWFGLAAAAYGLAMLLFGIIDDPLWSDDTMPILFIVVLALAHCYSRVTAPKASNTRQK